ncbi:hypothetical protein H0H93_008804 [Arthromyces matolae]|nr:hypothetical protein H0H93_008804 [Arthromyces matolae]
MPVGDSQNSSSADCPYGTKKDSDHKLVYQSPSFATKDPVLDELTISLRVCNKQDARSHPLKTAEFGRNSLSRLPLTPPIIARLTVRDSTGNSVVPTDSFGGMGVSDSGVILAEARTRPFDVLPYSQYAAAPRTRLTTSFIRQGARMFTFLS